MSDFLRLTRRDSVESKPDQSGERSRIISAINSRITQGDYADSLEVKVALLSHLIVTVWQDLKEGK